MLRHSDARAWAVALLAACPLAGFAQERFNATVRATQKVKPRIVAIRAKAQTEGGTANSSGSGVIFDPAGFVITNYHVVQNAVELTVKVYVDPNAETEQQRYKDFEGRVLAQKPDDDLAIVRIIPDQPGRLFPYMPLFGAGEALEGETVIAIGNPFGIGISISSGIVSAKDRKMTLPHGVEVAGLVQTSAPINPGNSGGALVNIEGNLLGINTAIRANAQGIGFALPTRMVVKAISELMGEPAIPLGRLGVKVQEKVIRGRAVPAGDLTPIGDRPGGPAEGDAAPGEASQAAQAAVVTHSTVLVSEVAKDSSAAKSSLQAGDEIREINGQKVGVRLDIERVLWGRQPGDAVRLLVRRGEQDFKVTMSLPRQATSADERIWQKLGIWVKPVPAERVAAAAGGRFKSGVIICAVNPQCEGKFPWQVGDIIVQLDQYAVRHADDVAFVAESADLAGKKVGCPLIRGTQFFGEAWVNLPPRDGPAAPIAVR